MSMLDEVLNDEVGVVDAQAEIVLDAEFDFEKVKRKHDAAIAQWQRLTPQEQAQYSGRIDKYCTANEIVDPKSPKLAPARNYSLAKKEVEARLKTQNYQEQLPIDALYFEQTVLELVENIENLEHIKELYRLRKLTVGSGRGAGINTDEAGKVKNCLRQGRELFLSGKNAALMVKPLSFFYSITAYSYGIILLNNPIRFSLDSLPSSHGMGYLPKGIKVQFGGDNPRGTFSELVLSFPNLFTRNGSYELSQDNMDSLIAFFQKKTTSTLGTLLSMIPELREYYHLITKKRSRAHPLEIFPGINSRQAQLDFHIGDGEHLPADVSFSFPGLKETKRYGKVVVEVPLAQMHTIKACIYTDVRGKFWYIENPFFPVILPEICLHFLLINAFSNIMRYSPDRWGSMLLNEVSSGVSLMARKYLSAFENKYPTMILRSLSRFYPHVA